MIPWRALIGVLAVAGWLSSCSGADVRPPNADDATRTYTTRFPSEENPIDEDGIWLNGAATGLDWGDVATKTGLAYGRQEAAVRYADGTAILGGSWAPDQTVEATVHVGRVSAGDYPEVELRLRSALTPHRCTGYEVQWGVARENPYFAIVRWDGARGDFQELLHESGSRYAVDDGAVIKATMIGTTIRAYTDGRLIAEVTDDTYAAGNPGMGFNRYCREGCGGPRDGFGLTSFSAAAGPDSASVRANGRRETRGRD